MKPPSITSSQQGTGSGNNDPRASSLVTTDSIAADIGRRYFDLGWDFGSFHSIHLPEEAPREMKQGWEEGRKRLVQRAPTRFERKWLSLRCNALRRNRVVDPDVTPAYIEKIMTGLCPVMGARLTCATGGDLDWSVDRVFNDGAYAPANLCVMSTIANHAKGSKQLPEVLACGAEALHNKQPVEGLTYREWLRLAAVMVGPHSLATNRTYMLPQATYIPPDLAVFQEQLMQEAILFGAIRETSCKVLGRLRARCNPQAERLLHKLVQTLRRKDGRNTWIFDVWLEPGVFERFQDWLDILPLAERVQMCDLVERIEYRNALVITGKEVSRWALQTGGYAAKS